MGPDSDWIVPPDSDSDSEATVELDLHDADLMAFSLGVTASDLGVSEAARTQVRHPAKQVRRLSTLVIGSKSANDAVQDCILEYRQQLGFRPVDKTKKSSNAEMSFVKATMRKRGWKLWAPMVGGYTPQWVRASAFRKIVKNFNSSIVKSSAGNGR